MNATELKNEIDKAFSVAETEHKHAQVCLWFAEEESELDDAYFGEHPEIAPVCRATVTTHNSGGGIARGGEHLDFEVDRAEWHKKSESEKLEGAKHLLESACEWSYENLPSPENWELAE